MFNNTLSEYIDISAHDLASKVIFDTKNGYEFTLVAIRVGAYYYALLENPDESRISDIDDVIADEFKAKTIGWCVLKKRQKELGEHISFESGEVHYEAITFEGRSSFFWFLVISPWPGSRLLR